MLGGFAPLPIRLGGPATGGWTAAGHARFAADLASISRTLPLCVMVVSVASGVATTSTYNGRDGAGVKYAPTVTSPGAGRILVTFSAVKTTEDDRDLPWYVLSAKGTGHGTAFRRVDIDGDVGLATEFYIRNAAGAAVDGTATLTFYGSWGPFATVDFYDGDPNKHDNETENPVPIAAQIYRDLQQQRGSAFSSSPTSLVHAENAAIARQRMFVDYRLPEKLRNNSTPLRADDGLEYWSEFLAIPARPRESRFSLRRRCSLQYRSTDGCTYDAFRSAVKDLLGEAFVDVILQQDDGLETPGENTYWPVINDGPATYDIGGGSWISERAHIIIGATQPSGMPSGEFNQLMNVELFQLVDQILPAWTTAQWRTDGVASNVWDGFLWDDGTMWDSLYDWNA